MKPQYIEITVAEYESLKEDSAWLRALEDAGVDNWDGLDHASDLYREALKDEEKLNGS